MVSSETNRYFPSLFAVDANGVIFAASVVYDWDWYIGTWLVRRSVDAGMTWELVDSFTIPGSWYGAEPKDITCEGHTVYVLGTSITDGGELLIVRRSADGGNTWTTVRQSAKSGTRTIFAHPTMGIFLAGTQSNTWIVERSRDGGITWTTVDQYRLDSKREAGASRGNADAIGNLYVTGRAGKTYKSGTQYYWTVRKSSNGGNTWTTVDSMLNGTAMDVLTDASGNLFVCGVGQASSSVPSQWLVRRCSSGTSTWATSDTFQYLAGYSSQPNRMAADPLGNVFVSGSGDDATASHWIVRKLTR